VCRSLPRFRLRGSALTDCLRFGRSLFVVGILTFVTTQFDNLVVGRYLGAAVLGGYLLAYRLASIPVEFWGKVVGAVMLPAYAGVHSDRPDDIPTLFTRINLMSSAALVSVMGLIALFPKEIVALLYGKQWLPAARFLTVLVLVGLFRGLAQTVSPLLIGVGRPDLDAKCKIAEAIFFVPLTYWAVIRFGAFGAAWTGAFCYAGAYVLRLWLAIRVGGGLSIVFAIRLLEPLVAATLGYSVAAVLLQNEGPKLLAAIVYESVLVTTLYAGDAAFRREMRAVFIRMRQGTIQG